jgi:hypothetical protein
MPFHFVTMALMLKEASIIGLRLPPIVTSFAARLRLWEAIGLESPVEIEPGPGGSRYHEITALKQLSDVENVADRLSGMLTGNTPRCTEGTKENLYIMLAELLGNCHHHARAADSLHGLACAQTWYRDARAQFAIADSGIGIRESLSENVDLRRRLADHNACDLASQYGISSKLGKGHAGYGLTLARDLAMQTPGSLLFVQSCNEAMLIDNCRVTLTSDFNHAYTGTLVLFEWDMNTKLDLTQVYQRWPNAEESSDDFF